MPKDWIEDSFKIAFNQIKDCPQDSWQKFRPLKSNVILVEIARGRIMCRIQITTPAYLPATLPEAKLLVVTLQLF